MKNLRSLIIVSLVIAFFAVSCKSEPKKGVEVLDQQGTELGSNNKPQSFDEIINGKTPVIVDFYAEWCGPCKIQAPILAEIQTDLGDKVRVVKVDVDVETALANRFGIQSIPTLYIFKEGKTLYKAVGVQEKEVLVGVVMGAQ